MRHLSLYAHSPRASADHPTRTDSCGTFLQFVIVAISSVYLVVRVGLRRQQDAQAELAEMQETIAAAKLADLERDVEGLLEKGPRTCSPPRLGPIHFPEREDTFV